MARLARTVRRADQALAKAEAEAAATAALLATVRSTEEFIERRKRDEGHTPERRKRRRAK